MVINIDSNKRWGIIGTVVFHIVLFVILLLVSLSPPEPPRPAIGLEINLGYSDNGMGKVQPKKPSVSSSKPKHQSNKANKKVVTQDVEETIKLESNKKDKVDDSKLVENKEPVVDKKFIFNKKTNADNGGSQGITNKIGDQGKSNGNPNSNNYVGAGGNGDGISYSLSGRNAKSIYKPINNNKDQGTVVVKIWVNNEGVVTNARVQVKGTTTSNRALQDVAIRAALKAIFNSDPNAPEVQTGTITYVFKIGG